VRGVRSAVLTRFRLAGGASQSGVSLVCRGGRGVRGVRGREEGAWRACVREVVGVVARGDGKCDFIFSFRRARNARPATQFECSSTALDRSCYPLVKQAST